MATLITSVRQSNAVRPREIAWMRHTLTEDVLPRVDVTTATPTQGAIAYNTGDNILYFADGFFWHPLAAGGPPPLVTLNTVVGALGQSIVGNGIGPNLTVKGIQSITPFIAIANTGTDVTINVPNIPTFSNFGVAAGNKSLVASTSVFPTFGTKGLVAGSNIGLSATSTDVTVAFSGATGDDVTLSNAGVGQTLVNDGTGPALATKGLLAGSDIGLTFNATDVTIAFTGTTGDDVTLSNAGVGQTLVNDGTGPALATKGLVGGSNIGLSSNATDVTIAYTGTTGADVTLSNAGAGLTLVNDGAGPNLATKGLVAGSDIGLTFNATDVTIAFTGTTGDDVTLTNAGAGLTLVNDGTGPALATKGLVAGSNIGLTFNATDVTVAYTGTTGGDVTLTSAGGTQTLVVDGVGPTLSVKGLTAGSNISLTPTASDVTIAYTGTTGADVTLSNAGAGLTLVNDGTGPALATKGLVGGTGISLSSNATDITVTATGLSVYPYKTIAIGDSPYALLASDLKVGVHTLTGAITVTLPSAATKHEYYITDIDGNSPVNKITINTSGGDTIGVLGGAPILVNSKYATIVLYSDGISAWFLE